MTSKFKYQFLIAIEVILKKKRFIIIAISILFVSTIWLAITPVIFGSTSGETVIAAPYPGFTAPDFSLDSPEGQNFSLSEYEGRPVLIIFWASWCSVCKRTMPGLQTVYEDYAPLGFEILAINTTYQDSYLSAVNYFEEQDYSFPFLIDEDGSTAGDYKTHALPTSVLVGPDGKVVDVVIGAGLSDALLRSQLDQLLVEEN